MPTCTWTEANGTDRDPYADWLDTIHKPLPVDDGTETWSPRVIQVKRDKPFDVEEIIEIIRGVLDVEQGGLGVLSATDDGLPIGVLWHDAARFVVQLLTGHAELIVFERGSGTPANPDFEPLNTLVGLLSNIFGADVTLGAEGAAVSGVNISDFEPPLLPGDLDRYFEMLRAYAAQDPDAQDFVPSSVPPVITGIVDHAIGFGHERFRDAGGRSRVAAIWMQQYRLQARNAASDGFGRPDLSDPGQTIKDPKPADIFRELGKVIEKEQIDDLLDRLRDGRLVDEVALYRAAGAIEFRSRRRGERPHLYHRTHGTQMLDIAAGYEPAQAPDNHPIYAVQLPAELVARTNGFLHEPYVKSALNWIWWRVCQQYGPAGLKRLVVNYSFGDYAGRHDGQDVLDADFECRIRQNVLGMMTVPAGNGFLQDVHARFDDEQVNDPNGNAFVDLMIQPDGKEASFVQIWLEGEMPNIGLQLEVTPPGCEANSTGIRTDGDTQALELGGKPLARIYYQHHTPSHPLCGAHPTTRTRITLAIRPTSNDEGPGPVAPAGAWTLRLSSHPQEPVHGTVNIWVERGDTVDGFPPRGRQAYLEHPNHVESLASGRPNEQDSYASPIKRFGTLGANANAPSVVAAGGWHEQNAQRMAYYSAARAHVDGPQPTLAMPVGVSAARPTILASGTCTGSVRPTQGTSIAAAHAARALAKAMKDRPGLTAAQAKSLVKGRAKTPDVIDIGPNTPRFPPTRVGDGLVDRVYQLGRDRVLKD